MRSLWVDRYVNTTQWRAAAEGVTLTLTLLFCLVAAGIHTNDHDAWQLYTQIQEESGLPLRVYMTPSIGELKKPATPRPGSKIGLLSCDRIKLFSDGSLGAVRACGRLCHHLSVASEADDASFHTCSGDCSAAPAIHWDGESRHLDGERREPDPANRGS